MCLQVVCKADLVVRSAQNWLARSRYNLLRWLLYLQLRSTRVLNTGVLDQNLRNQDLDSFVGEELSQQLLLVLSLELSNGNLMVKFRVSQMSLIDLGTAHVLKHSKSSSLPVLSLCIVHVL